MINRDQFWIILYIVIAVASIVFGVQLCRWLDSKEPFMCLLLMLTNMVSQQDFLTGLSRGF